MISLRVVTLCDAANEREGLLSVLGGGLTRVYRPDLPSPLGATLAMILETTPEDVVTSHRLDISVEGPEAAGIVGNLAAEFAPIVDLAPGSAPSSLPVIFALDELELPAYGPYEMVVRVDGKIVGGLRFEVLEVSSDGGI